MRSPVWYVVVLYTVIRPKAFNQKNLDGIKLDFIQGGISILKNEYPCSYQN